MAGGRLVVDASVAVKWFAKEDDDDRALAILAADVEPHAPDLLIAELTNILWKKRRAGLISAEAARAALESAPLFVSLRGAHMASSALDLAVELDHPGYDCFYLALAVELDCLLVTADARFLARLVNSDHANRAVALSDWTA